MGQGALNENTVSMHIQQTWENVSQRGEQEDLYVDGSIILKWNLTEIGWESVDWIYLAGDRKKWRAVLNTVMKLWVA